MNIDFQLCITKMDEISVIELTGLLTEEDVNITKPPEKGLLMMAVKDSFNTDFYLGEILVTKAEVEYSGKTGYAMVMGDEPDRALAVASMDAILQACDGNLKQEIMDFFTMQAKKIEETSEMEKRLTAKTKVSFETMVKG